MYNNIKGNLQMRRQSNVIRLFLDFISPRTEIAIDINNQILI